MKRRHGYINMAENLADAISFIEDQRTASIPNAFKLINKCVLKHKPFNTYKSLYQNRNPSPCFLRS